MKTPDNRTPRQNRARPDPWLACCLTPVLWLGTLLAFISIADGFRNSILHSLDFQWSPARLLAQHIDPWATYLAGDPEHRILLNQVPNYLHELYVAMLPFSYLPLLPAKVIWASINLLLVLGCCACVARLYELERRGAGLLTILVLTGTPFRVTIGNGQVTAVVLVCLALWAVAQSSSYRGLLLGGAWAKYSVPPVLALFLLLRKRWRLLLCSLLPPVAGFLFFYAWLPTPFWTLLAEPFRAGTTNVSPGLANVMAIAEIAQRHPPLFRPIPDAFYLASRQRMDRRRAISLRCTARNRNRGVPVSPRQGSRRSHPSGLPHSGKPALLQTSDLRFSSADFLPGAGSEDGAQPRTQLAARPDRLFLVRGASRPHSPLGILARNGDRQFRTAIRSNRSYMETARLPPLADELEIVST